MPRKKPVQPSIAGVSGHDVYNSLKTLWDMPTTNNVSLIIETNALGGLYICCTVLYERGGEEWECVSEDTWSPYSATLQAHIYRCVFNAAVEVDKSLAGLISMNAKLLSPSRPVEPLPPSPSFCQGGSVDLDRMKERV